MKENWLFVGKHGVVAGLQVIVVAFKKKSFQELAHELRSN